MPHRGRIQPLLSPQGWVRVDGRPICAVCGDGIRLTGPNRWRHVPRGQRYTGRSRWLAPVALEELWELGTYEVFGERYPWAVRADFGGPIVTSEEEWREGVRRLRRYRSLLQEVGRRRKLTPGENPYLDLVRLLLVPAGEEDPVGDAPELPPGLYQMLDLSGRRRELAALFSWAIPGEAALDTLARYAPLLECGAGMGYWAALLEQGGVDILAYDLRPPGAAPNTYHGRERKPWACIVRGSSVAAVRRNRDRVLFLCWPPHDDDAASYAPLRAYTGDVLVYAGEGREGVTGTVRFHRELALNWTPVEDVDIPRWPWLGDRLVVYRRTAARRPLVERDRCEECRRFLPTGRFGRCDWCFERRPPALALRVGVDRIEYPSEYLDSVPPALRAALERSPNRIK